MMKNQILFNPFIYIAGYASLGIGIGIILFTSFIAWMTGTHQVGLLQFRLASDTKWIYFLIDHSLNWIIICLFLFLSGLFFSPSRIRFIDIAGTSAMSRVPMLILPLVRLIPAFRSFQAGYTLNLLVLFIVYGVIVIWSITLLYNAFKVSCNITGQKRVFTFIGALLSAEIITQILLYFIYKH